MRTKNSQLFKITSVDPIQSSNHRPLARYYGTASSNLFFEIRIFFLSFIVRIISLISMAFWGYFTVVSTQLMIISELCCSISYRRSNTFSLKTYPFIDLLFLWTLRELYSVKEPCHMRMHFVCRLNWRQISLQLKSLSLSFWYSDSFFQLKLQICNCIIIINSPSSFWKKKWLIYLDSENRMYYLANLP